jgi:hypothetical protein
MNSTVSMPWYRFYAATAEPYKYRRTGMVRLTHRRDRNNILAAYLQQQDGLKLMPTPSWTAHLIFVLPQTTLKIFSSCGWGRASGHCVGFNRTLFLSPIFAIADAMFADLWVHQSWLGVPRLCSTPYCGIIRCNCTGTVLARMIIWRGRGELSYCRYNHGTRY